MRPISILDEMQEVKVDPVKEVEDYLEKATQDEKRLLANAGFKRQLGLMLPSEVRRSKRRVYHIDEIKRICVKYNFKFLSPELYKGKISSTLGASMVEHEKECTYGVSSYSYKLLAPRESFQKVYDPDPILFYSLGNNYYEVVERWGKDITFMRRIRAFLQLFLMQSCRFTGWDNNTERNWLLSILTLLMMGACLGITIATMATISKPMLHATSWTTLISIAVLIPLLVIYPLIEYAARAKKFAEPDNTWVKS